MAAKQQDGAFDVFALDGVDELFSGDPAEFVAARDRLAKRLRADGERDAAKAVKGLRRPTVVAWGVNQVARKRPDRLAELADAGAEVRDAYARLLTGEQGDALRDPSRRRRKIILDLADDVAELVGESHRDEAAQTFEAASLDESAFDEVSAGRLTSALVPPSGFDVAHMPAPAPVEKARKKGPDPLQLRRSRKALERAEQTLREATDGRAQAEERLEAARADAVRAREAVEAAQDRRDEAAKDLERIEEG